MICSLSPRRKRAAVFAVLFIGILAVYLARATASGLWFDESIEYYFSSSLQGSVPGARGDYSMYKRILTTYQPPLYNWLMYVWLSILDSEFWFRLAGILVTFIGSAGLYLGLKEIMDRDWAAAGSAAYLLAGGVSEYALEAGEYNLLLCMMCWVLCFYLRALRKEKSGDLFGFIVFCCLAVYSQYGAVFLIVPMYGALAWHFLKRKKKTGNLIAFSLLAAAAAVPLVVYFLLPQMQNQGSAAVSHRPVFAYGVIDPFVGLAKTVFFSFKDETRLQFAAAVAVGALALTALQGKNKTLIHLLLLFICGWVSYYLITACTFYGYNGTFTPDKLGTANIGGRYSLGFAPLLTATLVYGVYCACSLKIEKKTWLTAKRKMIAALCLLMIFSAFGFASLLCAKPKDDVREAVQVWYEKKAYESKTLIDNWDDPIFQFYVTHHPDYSEAYQDRLILAPWWGSENPALMKNALDDIKLLDADDFYYLSYSSETYEKHALIIRQLFMDCGFTVELPYQGISTLIHAFRE